MLCIYHKQVEFTKISSDFFQENFFSGVSLLQQNFNRYLAMRRALTDFKKKPKPISPEDFIRLQQDSFPFDHFERYKETNYRKGCKKVFA